MSSPTQRSLKLMRSRGYLCDITERWVPAANIRKDLYGFVDILCVSPKMGFEGEGCSPPIVGVQSTSYSNVSARVKKIMESPNLPIVAGAGIMVVVHGWRKVKNRWVVKEVWLTEEGE